MSEDVARAVGAQSPTTITICGKECRPRPLTIRELTELQRDCLQKYRRQYVEAYSSNADLLPEAERSAFIREKIDEAAKLDFTTLPKKDVYDPGKIVLNEKVETWLEQNVKGYKKKDGAAKDKHDLYARRTIAACLDADMLLVDDYKEMTGELPKPTKVGYVNWWVTGTFEGMISMIKLAFKGCGVSEDELAEEISRNPSILMNASREVEHLSAPEVGNG